MNTKFTGNTNLLIALSGFGLLAAMPAHAQFMDKVNNYAEQEQYQNYAAAQYMPQEPVRPVYNGTLTTPSSPTPSPTPVANQTTLALPPTTLPSPIWQQAPAQPAPPLYPAAYQPVSEPIYSPTPYVPPQEAYPAPVAQDQDYRSAYAPRNARPAPIKWQDPSITIMPVNTLSGFDIGVGLSEYRYQEHVVPDVTFMHLIGPKFSLLASGTKSYKSGFYWGGDLRAAYGKSDYTGGDTYFISHVTIPSIHPDENEWLVDGRILAGRDFLFGGSSNDGSLPNYALSPYAGLGYRYLYNDGRGSDSNGVGGYRRFSNYVYMPLGVTQRMRVTDTTRASLNFEFDPLLYGLQVTAIGDSIPGFSPLHNPQNGGYGLRGNLMYEWPAWSVGPYFNYWNINQSDTNCVSSSEGTLCGAEPHNQTIEFGAMLKYHFTVK